MKNTALLLSCLICFACTPNTTDSGSFSAQGGGSSFTEQQLLDYIKLYSQLKASDPTTLEALNEAEVDITQQAPFAAFEKMIQDGGMAYADFVNLNSKVGTIYSLSEVNMQTFQEANNQSQAQMQSMIDDLQKMLDDPNTPESSKAQLRTSLQQAKNGKEGFQDMYNQNQAKTQDQIKRVQNKLNAIASQEEILLVDKHKKAIKEAFDGVFRPGRRDSQTF